MPWAVWDDKGGLVATETREAKGERILDAAVVEFARSGFYGTTVADIARRAGVADGTIYLYFKNKEDVLVSIFERAMDRFISETRVIVEDDSANAAAKLRRIVELHLSLVSLDRDMAVILQVELRHSLHFLELFSRSRIREYLGLIAEVVDQGRREGVFRKETDPLFAAKAAFGLVDEMATDWVLSKKNVRLVSRAEAVSDLLLTGLAA
jgi:TetR/AcrR family transcriptional regulator, fatty acid metabolism regulator protein